MEKKSIPEEVSRAYTRAVSDPAIGCCCGGGALQQKGVVVKTAGYEDGELVALPTDAVVNSFGCGNLLAFSEVKEGDVVPDRVSLARSMEGKVCSATVVARKPTAQVAKRAEGRGPRDEIRERVTRHRGACIIASAIGGCLTLVIIVILLVVKGWNDHQDRARQRATSVSRVTSVSSDRRGTTAPDFAVGDVRLREPLDEVQRRIGRPQASAAGRDGSRELIFRNGALRVTVNRDGLVTVVEARELKRKGKPVLRVGDAVGLVVPLLGPTIEDHSTSLEYSAPQKTVSHENRSFRYHWGADQLSVETLDEKVSHIYVQTLGPVSQPRPASPSPVGPASGSPGASDRH